MADKALIQGARELAASRGFVDYAGSFSKGFDSAGRKAKKEQKILEINNKVSEYYDTVDLDVDLSGFSPETKNIYEQQLIGYKEQVYQNATALANIDASDPKYLEYKSKLNSINSSVSNMAAQAELLQQLGSEYRTINTSGAAGLGGFSVGADPANVEDMRKIFLDKSVPLQVDETGNLHYNVNGKKYSVKDFKMPLLKASQQGKFIIDKNSSLSTLGRALTPANVDALKNQYKDLISSKGILSSLLSTDFTDIPTEDMDIEDYDNWEDARDEFINRLAISNKSAAANSVVSGSGYDPTGTEINISNQVRALTDMFNNGDPILRETIKWLKTTPKPLPSGVAGPSEEPTAYIRYDLNRTTGRWEENKQAGDYTDPMRIAGDLQITYK
jgi:hypothetical protein